MGRSAHADDCRTASSRRHAGSHSQFAEGVGVSRKRRAPSSRRSSTPCATTSTCACRASCACTNPLKVVLTNYPEDQVEELDASYYPHDVPLTGSRKVPFSRELYIERDDFMEDPPKKFFRLAPGREVRLRYGYFITCKEVIKDTRATSWSCAARTIRRRAAAIRPTAARCRARFTGCRRVMPSTASAALRQAVHAARSRRVPEGQDFLERAQPRVAGRRARCEDRAQCGGRSGRDRGISSSARATSSMTRPDRSTAGSWCTTVR